VDFMGRAAKLAKEGVEKGEGGPFGAVVVQNGKVVGEACNRVLATNDPTAHAEILAIRAAAKKLGRFHLEGCEIYTTCEPCPMCLAAIHWAHLDRVHYAMTRHDAAAIGFDDAAIYEAMTAPRAPLLHEPNSAAKAAFDAWRGKADRVRY
jgi:tRNA(Arg) A34 adenosine deaminase TadA